MKRIRLKYFLAAALSLSLVLLVQSCGDDKDDDPEIPGQDQVDPTPEPEPEPEPEPKPEPTPDPDEGKYYVPEPDEFLGVWQCVYSKDLDGTVYTEWADIRRNWTSALAFTKDMFGQKMIYWDDAFYLDEFNEAIKNKGDVSCKKNAAMKEGAFTDGYYHWNFYEDKGQLNIKEMNNKSVRAWWRISKFDGESFEMTPYFTDQGCDFKIRRYVRWHKKS